jgi:murein DD-endopeptidase MepM/ murein hydrolase activator NlpD
MNAVVRMLTGIMVVLLPCISRAQFFETPPYPKGYFRNPLDIPISLSGNFGELRPNHYHMGLDFKTEKRENLRVYAAAGGFVSRIKIEPGGFGRAIYIEHPNGFTTLYCHLNDFYPALEQWVRAQQEAAQQWEQSIQVPRGLFPIKQGDFIAMSGNTGGSQAPHLHFEIRRTNDDVNLNPQLFGFPLADQTKPTILRLGIHDRNQSTYAQGPQIVTVRNTGGMYTTQPALIRTSAERVSFSITTYDTHTGSSNLNGVFEGELWVDDKPIIGFRMDQISYLSTRYMNAHIDYRTKMTGGPYLQHLSELPGFLSSIYQKRGGDGVIQLGDQAIHRVRIISRDAAGNQSELQFNIQYNGAPVKPVSTERLYYPMMMEVYESPDLEFFLGERCLYDRTSVAVVKKVASDPQSISAVFSIGSASIPLQDSMVVRIQPNRTITEAMRSKTLMRRTTGAKKGVQKVEWQGLWASAKFRDFGNFELVVDTEAPQILPVGFTDGTTISPGKRLMVTVKDNQERFKSFRGEVDGKWLRFTNDKGKTFTYQVDEKFPKGEHILSLRVEDEAGNIAQKNIRLICL